ncbi:MAG: MFS transporter [Haloferacaceae archaeon]
MWLYAWALGYAAIGAASLLVPLYAIELGADPLVAGALEATAGLAGVPGALIWGRLADRTGQRRTFVLITLVGAGFVLAAFPLLSALPLVLLANGVLWFVVAAATPVVTLFMIERVPEREWETRIGLLNAYQRYGWVGGLVAGTVWLGAVSLRYGALFAQRTFFLLCAAVSLAAVPLAFYWLPPAATTSPSRVARSTRVLTRTLLGSGRYVKLVPYAPSRAVLSLRSLGSRRFLSRYPSALRRYLLTAFVFSVAFSVFFGPAPAFLTSLAYPSATVFAFFIVSSLASAVVFVPVGRLTARVSPTRLQVGALSVRVVLFPVVGLLGLLASPALRAVGIGVGFALVGLTWAVVAVTAAGLVSRVAPADVRGEALGLYAALSGLGGGVGGVAGGLLASTLGYQWAFVAAGLLVLVSVLVLLSAGISVPPSGTATDLTATLRPTTDAARDE